MTETVGIRTGVGDLHEDMTRDFLSPQSLVQGFEPYEPLPDDNGFGGIREQDALYPQLVVSTSLGSLDNFCDTEPQLFKERPEAHDDDFDLPDGMLTNKFENDTSDQVKANEESELNEDRLCVLENTLEGLEMVASTLTSSENSTSGPTISGLSTIPSNGCNTAFGLCDALGDVSAETSAPPGMFFRCAQPVVYPYLTAKRPPATGTPQQALDVIDLTKDDDSEGMVSGINATEAAVSTAEEAKDDGFLNAILDGVESCHEEGTRLDGIFNDAAAEDEDGMAVMSGLVPSLDKMKAVLDLETQADDVDCTPEQQDIAVKEELTWVKSGCSGENRAAKAEHSKQRHKSSIDRTMNRASKASCAKAKRTASSVSCKKKKLSKREAARAASLAEHARQREIAMLAKTKQITDDELLKLKPKKQRRAAKFDKPIPSRFCHVCSRTPKNVRLAVCCKIKEGICRKVICEKCFEEFGFGDFEAALETGTSSWCCPHCTDKCPGRAQCRTYQRINDRLRVNRLKQEKPKGRRRGRRTMEDGEGGDGRIGGGSKVKRARFLLPGPGEMASVEVSGDTGTRIGGDGENERMVGEQQGWERGDERGAEWDGARWDEGAGEGEMVGACNEAEGIINAGGVGEMGQGGEYWLFGEMMGEVGGARMGGEW